MNLTELGAFFDVKRTGALLDRLDGGDAPPNRRGQSVMRAIR